MTTAFFSLETTGIDDACGATVAVVNDRVFHSGFGKEMDAATGVEVLDVRVPGICFLLWGVHARRVKKCGCCLLRPRCAELS